jgi:hypothetical protein
VTLRGNKKVERIDLFSLNGLLAMVIYNSETAQSSDCVDLKEAFYQIVPALGVEVARSSGDRMREDYRRRWDAKVPGIPPPPPPPANVTPFLYMRDVQDKYVALWNGIRITLEEFHTVPRNKACSTKLRFELVNG